MYRKKLKKIIAATVSSSIVLSAIAVPVQISGKNISPVVVSTSSAADNITIDDMPADFKTAAEWIWQNRIEREQSTARRNTVFDQIVAGKGTINYVVKWQSYKELTYEQRQKFEVMLSNCINDWNDWLKGYENWPYDHIDVKIVGWAVIDKSCLLDLHDDEIVYTDTKYYDSQYDTSNGREEIPDKEPFAPSEISRFDHFTDTNYEYPGGLDKRFDMYMWATQGFPDIGGCGGDWGQRLSDNAYLAMIDGQNIHVLEHEIGHGFGMTDFYGGEGEIDGFPPGGFPGGENSLMMAGSASKITNFDGWMLRYMWTKIKNEENRFDLENNQPVTTETTTTTSEATTTTTSEITTTQTTVTTTEIPYWEVEKHETFTDTIVDVGMYDDNASMEENDWIGWVQFKDHGTYFLSDGYSTEDSTNLAYYEPDDIVTIDFIYKGNQYALTDEQIAHIIKVNSIELVHNAHETTTATTTETTETTTVTTSAETTTTTVIPTEKTLLGDANEDDTIDIADATAIIQHIGNRDRYALSAQGEANADCYNTGDGITGMDAVAIQKLEAGLIDSLPEMPENN